MLTFIHTYSEECFEGLFRSGLFRAGDGIKLMHKSYLKPSDQFNEIAREDSLLYNRIKELGCPFYIDRLQGGIPYRNRYPYDPALLAKWREMLEDKFLGFQMHEWASNFRNCDCRHVQDLFRESGFPSPDNEQRRAVWDAVLSGEKSVWTESMHPFEWREHRLPRSQTECIEDIHELYRLRTQETDGLLIPADSFYMVPRIEIANGAKLLLPEVGWQIPGMRIQMAYNRGQARAAGIPFGIYLECWEQTDCVGGLTIPFSLSDCMDEWHEDQLHRGAGYIYSMEQREKGGMSNNLEARVLRYGYLSGASYMGEEYGVCNTFRNCHDFDLSPYGRTKRDFLRFSEKNSEIGTQYTPVAVVLPAKLPLFPVTMDVPYLGFPAQKNEISDHTMEIIENGIHTLVGTPRGMGNECHVITNSRIPDVFDILHADQAEALAGYEYLIDLTDDPAFAKAHPNCVTPEELNGILDRLLPCRVSGTLHTLYRKLPGGGWLLWIANNEGIVHDNFEDEKKLPEAATAETVNTNADISVLEKSASAVLARTGDGYSIKLEAGDWILLRISDTLI